MDLKTYRSLPYWVRQVIVIFAQLTVIMIGVLLSASTAPLGELHHQPVFDVAADTPKTCPEEIADMATSILKVILPLAGLSSTTTNTTSGGM